LVLAGFQVRDYLLGDFRQIPTLDVVVGLQKDFAEAGFTNRVIFEVEFVEPME
jgi:hypothetical protein